ncbi:MAG: tetrahydrofolate dehydrogenase/cyclohydrolase catalytic domain-containing protein, partial [Longimicrobiales bacterium]
LLDGVRLAAERAPRLASRYAAYVRRHGRPPGLALVAFESRPGYAPHVARKRRACAAVGLDVHAFILPGNADEDRARDVILAAAADPRTDAVFVQFPLAEGIDESAVFEAIVPAKDVDVLHPTSFESFLAHEDAHPPVTVGAGFMLLDRYDVGVANRTGIVVGAASPLTRAFEVVLARRGATVLPGCAPTDPELAQQLAPADLVFVVAGVPGVVAADAIAPGTVAVDVGYFNPGARGDIDVASGTHHLAAIAPVPGGIGPMTVSALIERTLDLAEEAERIEKSDEK